MSAVIDVNDLASLTSFQNRVRARLMAHAFSKTAKAPTKQDEEMIYNAARQVIQSGGNSSGNIPLIVAVQLGGNYAATDEQITKAIDDRTSEVYNVILPIVAGKNSPNNSEFLVTVRRQIAKTAQSIIDSASESAIRKQYAAQALSNIQTVAYNVAQLAADNPKGEPLTDASTTVEVNKAIRDAFLATAPSASVL